MAFGVDDAVLAAGITAAGSALAGGASAAASSKLNKKTMAFNREEAEKQRQWNEAMADKQNAWNYEMWLKQNEYNNPVNQIERLKAAGLNPLYYGLDGSSAGEVTAAQPLAYERASIDNMPNPVASGMSAAAQVAQISNLQANTAKVGQETLTEVQRREKIQAEILNTKQEFNNMLAQEGLDKAKKEEIERGLYWLDRINDSLLSMRESETELNRSQKKRIDELLEGEKLYQAKSIEDFDRRWAKISSEIRKYAAETDLLAEDLEQYALNHSSNGVFGSGMSLQNIIRYLIYGDENGRKKHPQKPEDQRRNEGDAFGMIYDNK